LKDTGGVKTEYVLEVRVLGAEPSSPMSSVCSFTSPRLLSHLEDETKSRAGVEGLRGGLNERMPIK
jgi:hypothetical protein